MFFPKKIALEYSLSCIIGKGNISFSRKYDLTPRRKLKDDLSKKKYTEIWYFPQIIWKDCRFKKHRVERWSFLYSLERWYFFPENVVFFPWTEDEGGVIFLKKYTETWYFLLIYSTLPCQKKKSKMILFRKDTPKGDWHSSSTP